NLIPARNTQVSSSWRAVSYPLHCAIATLGIHGQDVCITHLTGNTGHGYQLLPVPWHASSFDCTRVRTRCMRFARLTIGYPTPPITAVTAVARKWPNIA